MRRGTGLPPCGFGILGACQTINRPLSDATLRASHLFHFFSGLGRKPISFCSRGLGFISSRIASKTALNCLSCRSYFPSSSSSRRANSLFEVMIWRNLTNVLIISTFTAIARLLRNTLDNIATPCSVKAVTRLENFRLEDVTNCDIPAISSRVSSNMKSGGIVPDYV